MPPNTEIPTGAAVVTATTGLPYELLDAVAD